MKTAVVYKSVTGNTKMIANAIAAVLGDECVYLGGAEGAPTASFTLWAPGPTRAFAVMK